MVDGVLDQERELENRFHVGKRLLGIRLGLGLSQREVARRAGMTNGNLSLIEQGKISPSIQSLEKILAGVSVTLADFFTEVSENSGPVIKQSDFLHITKGGAEYWVKHLQGLRSDNLSIAREIIPPQTSVVSEWMLRKGVAVGLVVQGELDLQFDGQNYQVLAGEGFQVSLSLPVCFHNHGDTPITMVTLAIS